MSIYNKNELVDRSATDQVLNKPSHANPYSPKVKNAKCMWKVCKN